MMLARKKPFTRLEPLVPKAQTRRLGDKGPVRDGRHLAHVRSLLCLCCAHGRQTTPTRAHHPKGLFPRTIGKRVSDLLCLPLCDDHHTVGPDALHRGGDELGWWRRHGIDPYGCILSMLAGNRDSEKDEAVAFVKLHRERAAQEEQP
jgi:hypothetical protein